MSYSYQASDILALAKVLAVGGSTEPAYPSSDTDWYILMSAVWRSRVYPALLRHGGETWVYKVARVSFSASQSTYAIRGTSFVASGDFHRARELVIDWDSTRHEVVPRLEERHRAEYSSYVWSEGGAKGYCLHAADGTSVQVLELLPTPSGACSASLSYVPQVQTLTAASVLCGPEGVDLVLAHELAAMSKGIQGESYGLEQQRKEAWAALQEAAGNRHHDEPLQVTDVYPEGGSELRDLLYLPRA